MASTVGNTPQGYDYRFSPHSISGCEYNGNIYVFVTEGAEFAVGDLGIHILKSTNGGSTWNQVGGITSGASEVRAYATCQDGNLVYILYTDTFNGSSGTDVCSALVGWTFDMSADTLSSLSLTSAPTIYKLWHGATPSGFQVSKCVALSLVRRSSGSFWFAYSGAPEAISSDKWARVYIASFDGSAFSGATAVPGQSGVASYFVYGSANIDPSGNLHSIIVGQGHYYHIGLDSGGSFGTFQTVELDTNGSLDPPPHLSNIINFSSSGDKIAFIGISNAVANAPGDITLYHGNAALNPTWAKETIAASGVGSPIVITARISGAWSTSLNIVNNKLYAFWTVSGHSPTWDSLEFDGRVVSRNADISSLSTWSAESDFINAPVFPGALWSAAQVNTWVGDIYGLEVFVGFAGYPPGGSSDPIELALFNIIPADTANVTRLVSDAFPGFGDTVTVVFFGPLPPVDADDAISLADGQPQLGLSVISNPGDNIVPPPPGTGTPGPTLPPIGLSTCIFEFYEMQKPEDVEVLPVPKRFDQLGPMRFDKIGKIFALRIRLIMNGTTTSLPYAIYGDDSETSPHLNSALFADSFAVRPGFDNVYEIQLPKSVNTDVFRLTLGPVADSFHRYNVIVKVHISGMQGQAKWLPIR